VSVLSVVGTVISRPTREETEENVNHTQRIAHVARQRRALTKAVVREAVDRYFEVLADDIASGKWIDLPGIGKIQVIQEESSWHVDLVWREWKAHQAARDPPPADEGQAVREVPASSTAT